MSPPDPRAVDRVDSGGLGVDEEAALPSQAAAVKTTDELGEAVDSSDQEAIDQQLKPHQLAGADLVGAKLPKAIRGFDGLRVADEASRNASAVFLYLLVACGFSWFTIVTTSDGQLLSNTASAPIPFIQNVYIPMAGIFRIFPMLLLGLFVYFHLDLQNLWMRLSRLPAVFPDGYQLNEKVYPWLPKGTVLAFVPRLASVDHKIPKFGVGDIIDWPGFVSKLNTDGNTAQQRLGKRIWELLPQNIQSTVKESVDGSSLQEEQKSKIIKAVNRILDRQDFYQEQDFPDMNLPEAVRELLLEQLRPGLRFPPLFPAQRFLSLILLWWLVPFTVLLFWVYSLVLHETFWTYFHIGEVGISVGLALFFRGIAIRTLRGKDLHLTISVRGAGRHMLVGLCVILILLGAHRVFWAPIVDDSRYQSIDDSMRKVDDPHPFSIDWIRAFSIADIESEHLSKPPDAWDGKNFATIKVANLRGKVLRHAKGSHAFFVGAKMRRAKLDYGTFTDADFRKAKIKEGSFLRAKLNRADFSEANLSDAKLRFAELKYAKLIRADLENADFRVANLRGSELPGANLTDAKLADADLRGADLTGANLTGANLTGAELTGPQEADLIDAGKKDVKRNDLRPANIEGADLTGARIHKDQIREARNWKKACYDEKVLEMLKLERKENGAEERCKAVKRDFEKKKMRKTHKGK